MKCKICKQKIREESYYGMREFAVCSDCFGEMVREKSFRTDKSGAQACHEIMTILFDMGDQVKRIKKRNGAGE